MASLYELQQQGPQGTGSPVLDKAVEINESTANVYARIRANADLSDEGKRRLMAKAYLETESRMAEHRVATEAARVAETTRLTRQAFGAPSDPIQAMSYRHAQQIAEQIDHPQIAAQKLSAALTEGDTLLAKAIARHAVDRSASIGGFSDPQWGGVVDAYTTANPDVGSALNQLAAIQQPDSLVESLYFMTPKPSELDRLHEHQIEQLASEPGA